MYTVDLHCVGSNPSCCNDPLNLSDISSFIIPRNFG